MKYKHINKTVYDPRRILKYTYPEQGDFLEEKNEIEFNIGQCYEDIPARTLICKHCGCDTFKVGQGNYFTAIKCINCEYEVCVHDG